jgi:hypothetical protein
MIEIETGSKVLYGKRKVDVKEGNDIDEMKAHVFLEKLGETLTVRALRKRLADLDIDKNHKLCLSEYLLAKYEKTPEALVNTDQGSGVSPDEMKAAQDQFAALQEQFQKVATALEEATVQREQAVAAKEASDAAAAKAKVCKRTRTFHLHANTHTH